MYVYAVYIKCCYTYHRRIHISYINIIHITYIYTYMNKNASVSQSVTLYIMCLYIYMLYICVCIHAHCMHMRSLEVRSIYTLVIWYIWYYNSDIHCP